LTNIRSQYVRARLDWWMLDFSDPSDHALRLLHVLTYVGGILSGAFLCWLCVRRRKLGAGAVDEPAPGAEHRLS
jgi:hypothetical protein